MKAGWLACPHCFGALQLQPGPGRTLGCAAGHRFDVAREGYVNLLPPSGRSGAVHGDTDEMVNARRAFLGQDFYLPLSEAVGEMVAGVLPLDRAAVLLDAGCGEGYLLQSMRGLIEAGGHEVHAGGFDLSRPAVRQAARLMPDAAMFVANIRHPWPVVTASVDVLLNIFAPRNPGEFQRVVRSGGHLVVVIPAMDHLSELRDLVPLLPIAADKEDTLRTSLEGFALAKRREVAFGLKLQGPVAEGLLAMTPNAWAVPADARQQLRNCALIETRASFILLLFCRESHRLENP